MPTETARRPRDNSVWPGGGVRIAVGFVVMDTTWLALKVALHDAVRRKVGVKISPAAAVELLEMFEPRLLGEEV